MVDWILQGKITRPARAPGFLSRALWPEQGLPPVTLLLAGPGHGKSQALISQAELAEALGYTCAWLTADALDADPRNVFLHLLAAVRQHVPSFGQETQALLGNPQLDPRVLWQVALREWAAYNAQPGVILFIDDAHHLHNHAPELLRGLAFHFDKLPAGVHVMIASRVRFSAPLERLIGQGHLRELGPNELRFSEREATKIWHALRREPLPDDFADSVRMYEGWPAGVSYVVSRATPTPGTVRGTGPLKLAAGEGPRVSSAQLLRYIAEEMLGAQPARLQAFMLRAALLLAITPAACEAACELPDVLASLEELVDAHLLERQADALYRFPSYLRDFLTGEAVRRLSPEDLRGLHARAGRHYLARHKAELAFPHLIEGHAWQEAIEVLCREAPALLARGAQATLQRWLTAFPAQLPQAAWVAFYWGRLAWRAGESGRAVAHWQDALAGFRAEGAQAGATKALVRLYTAAITQEDPAAARWRDELEAAIALSAAAEDRADLHLADALAADQRGDLDGWQAANEAVLAMPVAAHVEMAQCACIAHMNLFTLMLNRGNFPRARLHVEAMQGLAGDWNFQPEALYGRILRAHLDVLGDDMDAAGGTLRGLAESWEDALDWHDRAGALYVLGGYYLAQGEWRLAEEHLQRAALRFEQAGFPLGKKLPLERLAWLALQRERPADALALLPAPGELDRSSVHDLALRLTRARALSLSGDHQAAQTELTAIARDAEAVRAPLPQVKALLYAAATQSRAGQTSDAQTALTTAQALIDRHGFEFLRRQDALLWRDLNPPAPTHVAVTPAAGRLKVMLFGGFEVRLDDILLQSWPRRKAKVVLAALALTPRGLPAASLASLIEDQNPRLAGVQMCITALRRSLEADLEDGARSAFVKFEDDRYVLPPAQLQHCDVHAFSLALQAGLRARDSQPDDAVVSLQEALTLYRGGLLDEPFFEPYFEAEREGYRRQAIQALQWMHERLVYTGDESEARQCLERAIAIAPCDDDVVMLALKYHALRRAPERVRTTYWDHRKELNRRLSLTPSGDVEQAYKDALALSGAG
ncbi:MAG: BTAD domain-containing putative transcriptional regulator [Candidatus Sericytochromatia bacterium]|nr:BTAD domain-containing putative transcriptional regulator [Candidatus Sericytochromatia bacterium]